MDESDVTGECWLDNKSSAVELHGLLLVARNGDTGLHASGVVPDRNLTPLHRGVRTGGGEHRGVTRGMRFETRDKGTLRYKLDANLALEVLLFEELVPEKKIVGVRYTTIRGRTEALTRRGRRSSTCQAARTVPISLKGGKR